MRFRVRGESGTTLVEVLVATAIMGSAVLVLVTGMSTLINSSYQSRQSTTGAVVARDYAEALELAVNSSTWCSSSYTVSDPAPGSPLVPPGYSVTTKVDACPANDATTPQVQTILITVSGPGGSSETLQIAVRQP